MEVGQTNDVKVLGKKRTPRRKARAEPRNKIVDRPFLRVAPTKTQVSLGRDVLAALGYPAYVMWSVSGNFKEDANGNQDLSEVMVFLTAAKGPTKSSYLMSYCGKRPAAVTTVPKELRDMLESGRYWASAWSEPGQKPGWVKIWPTAKHPLIEATNS